jgi:hypothetical protein
LFENILEWPIIAIRGKLFIFWGVVSFMAFKFRTNKSGYKTFTDSDGTTRSVHKRVAEKKMGGPVKKGYEVHHRDGNKTNNRSSNLTVVKKSTHRKLHAKKK